MKNFFLIAFLFFLSLVPAKAQEDVLFWFVCPNVSQTPGLDLDRPIHMYLTAYATAATVTISQPAGGGFPTTVVTIPANSTTSVDMTTWLANVENTPPNTVLNYGIEIQSTAPISAYYYVLGGPSCLCNPEDFILKGNNALGTDFWIPGQDTLNNSTGYTPIPTNAFDIVATQNGTTVTITPSNDIVGHTAGTTFTVMLNEGQTYSGTAVSTLGAFHLRGSHVTSDKPIAITEKDDLLGYTSTTTGVFGADLIGDQIVPVNVLGTEYIPMYGNLDPPGDLLYVTATHDGTTITLGGAYITTINAGQTYSLSCPYPSGYLVTSYSAYVYQLSGIGSEVGSALLPQINCTGSSLVQFYQSSTIDFKLNLLVKNGGQGNFLVNGVSGVITAGMFTAVPATGGIWYSAQVPMPVSSYPIGSVFTVSNTTNLFQLGYLSSGPPRSGASFGYFSNYGGVTNNPFALPPSICVGDSIHLFSDTVIDGTYYWTGPGGFTSTLQDPFIGGSVALDSGVYQVIVDVPGCADTSTVTVAVHPYPLVKLPDDTTVCTGSVVNLYDLLSFNASDTVLWSTAATTDTITVSCGTYWLTISNAGCRKSDTSEVICLPVPTLSLGDDTAFCVGNTITLKSIQPPGISYLWSTGATTDSIVVSVGGAYWLNVSDAIGCNAADTVHVLISPYPAVNLGPDTANCSGAPVILQSSDTYVSPAYLWSSGNTAPVDTAALSGSYWLQVTVGGCSAADTVNVTILFDTFTVYNPDTAICKGSSVQVRATYNPAIRFQWIPTAGIAISNVAAPLITPDTSALYYLTGIYPGCPDIVDSIYIDVQPNPLLFIGGKRGVCDFDTIHLQALVSPGWYTHYNYSWNPVTSIDTSTKSDVVFTAGTFTNLVLTVSTPAGCSAIDSAQIYIYPDNFAYLDTMITLCPGDSVQLKDSIAPGTIATSVWRPGIYLNDSTVNDPWARPITSTNYTAIVSSQYGCLDTVNVFVNMLPAAVMYLGDSTTIYPGESYQINDQTNCTYFSWFPPTGLSNAYIPNPVATPQLSTKYIVYAKTEWGCIISDSINIYVNPVALLALPNAFTPGTSVNSYLSIIKRGEATLNYFTIFNRWGNKVFETSDIDAGWDGTYKGVPQPVGVYVYQIEAVTNAGVVFHKSGNVTLLR